MKLKRRPLLMSVCATGLILATGATSIVRARPAQQQPAAPAARSTSQPARLSLEELTAKANAAFDAGDYAAALPMLKDLSVRQRNEPEKVAPLLEKIRVCEANLAQDAAPIEGINAPRTPHPEPAEGAVYELELQKLGNFAYDTEQGGNIPDDVKRLDGSTVKLHGYMIPIEESDKITKFVLVPDLFACCFGQPPELQHTAVVVCPPGKAVTYFPDKISVQGKLKVAEKREEGFIIAIFELDASSIRPVVN